METPDETMNKIQKFIAALFGISALTVAGAGILTPGAGGGLLTQPFWAQKAPNVIATNAPFSQDLQIAYRNITASTTLGLTDAYDSISTASGSVTLNLPLLSSATPGQLFFLKDRTGNASTSNIVIVTATSTDKIDGATSTKITTNFGSLRIVVGASGWEIN
jgi:hypothetical protein